MTHTTTNKKRIYSNDNIVEEHFTCKCSSFEHTVRFVYYVEQDGSIDDEGLYLSVRLCSSGGFFHRVKRALAYVFGYKCRYGDYDEVVFKRQDADRLRDLLDTYINSGITIYNPETYLVKCHTNDPSIDRNGDQGC
jgi:hypothetical protein